MESESTKFVTLLGTASIQDYIFRSNRLRDNLGASYLVADAMNYWSRDDQKRFKIFVGGGNAALEFKDRSEAIRQVAKWSEWLIRRAPGLRVVAGHGEGTTLSTALDLARRDLFRNENSPPLGAELGALPVVRQCPATGLAASENWPQSGEWLSSEAFSKREAARSAQIDYLERYSSVVPDRYVFPVDLEALGIREGESQIALVHADGDGIGELFHALSNNPDCNQREQYQLLSKSVSTLARKAFDQTLVDLVALLPTLDGNSIWLREAPPSKHNPDKNRMYFPLRPIVDGGDDLTFVCQGRIGLSLAARYLNYFFELSRTEIPWDKLPELIAIRTDRRISACAGVLIMPQKFPFARGYEIAEQLVRLAKRRRRESTNSCWIDFHAITEGSTADIEEQRETIYRTSEGHYLCMRPYCVSGGKPSDPRWSNFASVSKEFQNYKKWPRSRGKRLLGALVEGQIATENLLAEFASRNQALPETMDLSLTMRKDGFDSGKTAYFDSLEMLDFYREPDWEALTKPASEEAESVGGNHG